MRTLLKASLYAQYTVRPNQNVEGPVPSKIPSLKDFSKAFSKAKLRRGVVGCCKLLGIGILCSCSCPCRSGHDVPINLNNSNVILYSATFYLYVNGKVLYPLKVRALRKGYPVYFKLSAMFLTQSKGYRTQRLKSKTQIKWVIFVLPSYNLFLQMAAL